MLRYGEGWCWVIGRVGLGEVEMGHCQFIGKVGSLLGYREAWSWGNGESQC